MIRRTPILLLLAVALAAPGRALATDPPPEGDGPVLELDDEEEPTAPPGGTSPADDERGPVDRTSLFDDLTDKVSRFERTTTLGGYGELEYHNEEDADSYFISHRYVLFIYSQIAPRISTSTELELEFGGTPAKRDGVQSGGEAILEFSVVDFEIAEWLVLRGGVILVPFGAFNIRHDSPTRDLTERPVALTTITPSTWFEAGFGFLGEIPIGDSMSLSYEFYVINGLDAKITEEFGMKGAVGSKGEDNNDDKAVVGRIAFSPLLGMELGVSGYTGEYDDSGNRVHMVSGDLTLKFGFFEFLAEYVRAFIDEGFVEGFSDDSPANTRTAVPTGMQGWYAQMNFHFHIPGLWDLLPEDLADSQLTAVLRYEDSDPNVNEDNRFDVQKLTFGLNYRPVEAYVLKTEVQLISRSLDGKRQDLFSGEWDPGWKFVSSVAFLF